MLLHQMSLTQQALHQNHWPGIDYKHSYKCRKWIHSVNKFQNDCPMEKAPKHKADLFLHVKGLLYKHVTDSNQKFLALVIPKAWKDTVLVEAHDKLGHWGATQTYCLIKHQYYWKGMNKDIRKYIAQCTLCCREKSRTSSLPSIDDQNIRPFDKIPIDLVTECETFSSGNKHILTIINHLTGWLEAFPIPDKSADTIVSTFINHYLQVHMCPRYILLDNGMEFKNHLMDQVTSTTWDWSHFLHTLPPSKQWEIRSLSQIFQMYL